MKKCDEVFREKLPSGSSKVMEVKSNLVKEAGATTPSFMDGYEIA